mgnify:CR=1 FL=1
MSLRRPQWFAASEYDIAAKAKVVADIVHAGGRAGLGSHWQLQGLGAHWETWMLAQGDMTAMQALQCATINGARYLGLERDLGSLDVGKLADLVVLDRNPLANIRDTDSINMVMLNGRLYDNDLNEVGGTAKRPRFWFEGR